MSASPWVETTTLAAVRADELTRADVVFRYGRYLYRSTGQRIG